MKLRFLSFLSLALCVILASAVVAQDEGRQRGGQRGGGRGGFGGGFGGGMGAMQGGGAMELLGMLRMEEVRKEIEMDEDTFGAIQGNMPDVRAMMQMSQDERQAKLKELGDKASGLMDEALTPKQQDRLMGLYVQQRGFAAVMNELIAKKVGVDEKTTKAAGEAFTESQASMRDKMREMFQAGGGGERPDFGKMIEESRKESEAAVGKVLSAEQKKALEELKGTKFDFPEMQMGRGGPGGGRGGAAGGRGGRGGGAGGRGPGNSDNR